MTSENLLSYVRGPLRAKYSLSSGATKWVEVSLGLARENAKVQTWLANHGGQPSLKAQLALNDVRESGAEKIQIALAAHAAWMAEQHAAVQREMDAIRAKEEARLAAMSPEERAAMQARIEAEGTVAGLADDEAVDVVYGRDGSSDDCFTVDARALKRAGYGSFPVEDNAVLWVSRRKWAQIAEDVL